MVCPSGKQKMIPHFPWHLLRQISLPPPYFTGCALEQSCYTVYITELVSWREIAAGGRFWELHSAWTQEFQGAFFFFLLVLTANIIGTLMIPEDCGDLCSFLQELDWKLLWTSQFSVWFSVLWVLLAAWLSNLVIHLFIAFLEQLWFIIQKQIITYFHECWGGNGNIERYLKDEMWGRNSSC